MSSIKKLLEIMADLRNPETGCPWDRQQDFSTIAPYTVEEAYEVADAVARISLSSGSIRPPGKLICPAWCLRSGDRSVRSTESDSSRKMMGISTAAAIRLLVSFSCSATGHRGGGMTTSRGSAGMLVPANRRLISGAVIFGRRRSISA